MSKFRISGQPFELIMRHIRNNGEQAVYNQMFKIDYVDRRTCDCCQMVSYGTDEDIQIRLSFDRTRKRTKLHDIYDMIGDALMSELDKTCEQCKTLEKHTVEKFIKNSPTYLILLCDRVMPDETHSDQHEKNPAGLDFDETLDLSAHSLDNNPIFPPEQLTYTLRGTISHLGVSGAGHYIASVRGPDGEFYKINDEKVDHTSLAYLQEQLQQARSRKNAMQTEFCHSILVYSRDLPEESDSEQEEIESEQKDTDSDQIETDSEQEKYENSEKTKEGLETKAQPGSPTKAQPGSPSKTQGSPSKTTQGSPSKTTQSPLSKMSKQSQEQHSEFSGKSMGSEEKSRFTYSRGALGPKYDGRAAEVTLKDGTIVVVYPGDELDIYQPMWALNPKSGDPIAIDTRTWYDPNSGRQMYMNPDTRSPAIVRRYPNAPWVLENYSAAELEEYDTRKMKELGKPLQYPRRGDDSGLPPRPPRGPGGRMGQGDGAWDDSDDDHSGAGKKRRISEKRQPQVAKKRRVDSADAGSSPIRTEPRLQHRRGGRPIRDHDELNMLLRQAYGIQEDSVAATRFVQELAAAEAIQAEEQALAQARQMKRMQKEKAIRKALQKLRPKE